MLLAKFNPFCLYLLIGLLTVFILLGTFFFVKTKNVNLAPEASATAHQTLANSVPEKGGSVKSVNDNQPETWWYGSVSEIHPNWVELTWKTSQRIKKIGLSFQPGRVAVDYKILSWDGKRWQDKVKVSNNRERYVSHYFFKNGGLLTDKIRLYLTKTQAGDHLLGLNEFYVYQGFLGLDYCLSQLKRVLPFLLFSFMLFVYFSLKREKTDSKKYLLALFLLALLFRLAWSFLLPVIPTSDAASYHTYARSLVKSHSYDGYGVTHSMYRPPGYPFFLAGIFTLFGENLMVVRIVQSILGALNVLLIYLIARKYFSQEVSGIAALIYTFYLENLFYVSILLTEVLFTFCFLLSVFFLLRRHPYFAGFFWGLASLTRPAILFFPLVVFLGSYHQTRKIKSSLKTVLLVVLCGGLVILPWTIRNYLVSKNFVLISSGGSVNLMLGNNPWSNGRGPWPSEDYLQVRGGKGDLFEEASPRGEAFRDKVYMRMGMNYIFLHPLRFISLAFKKIRIVFLPLNEIITCVNYGHLSEEDFLYFVHLAKIIYLFVVITSLIGLGLSLTAFDHHFSFFVAIFIILYLGEMTLFFGQERFRYPLIPFLSIFTAYCLSRLEQILALYRKKKAKK